MTIPETAAGATDADMFVRMLEDDEEIERLLIAIRARHTLDVSGPALSALTRALGAVEMLRIELRLTRNYINLGGA